MAVIVVEKPDSRTYTDGESIERKFTIRGTTSESTALINLKRAAGIEYKGMLRGNCTVEPVHIDMNHPENSVWEGAAPYAPPGQQAASPMERGDSTWSWETSGGTQHITQSLATVASYAPTGKTAPNHKGAIGVTGSGVEGVDITAPIFRWRESHIMPASVAGNRAYGDAVYGLTGRTNSSAFRTYDAGEVLFLGASTNKRSDGDYEITFSFAASPNKKGLAVGDITGIDKKGWEYLWVRYEDTTDQSFMVKQPAAVYVERVYEEGDFAGLLIGA